MGRRLERHVDWDLAERIAASGPIQKKRQAKAKKSPRPHFTYRQNVRGAAGSIDPWAAPKSVFKGPFPRFAKKLNRSERWPAARSYEHAREIGPSSEAVR